MAPLRQYHEAVRKYLIAYYRIGDQEYFSCLFLFSSTTKKSKVVAKSHNFNQMFFVPSLGSFVE